MSQIDRNNLFAIVEVSLNSVQNLDCPKIVDLMLLQCNNCIPLPTPTPTPTATTTPTLTPTPTPTRTPAAVFNTILTVTISNATVFGPNVGFNASINDRLEYNVLSGGSSKSANLLVGGFAVAQIDYTSIYVGQSFKYYRALTQQNYIGIFTDLSGGSINLINWIECYGYNY